MLLHQRALQGQCYERRCCVGKIDVRVVVADIAADVEAAPAGESCRADGHHRRWRLTTAAQDRKIVIGGERRRRTGCSSSFAVVRRHPTKHFIFLSNLSNGLFLNSPSFATNHRSLLGQMLGQMLGQKGRVMPRKIDRLSARAVATISACGRHADGGGLYLSISPNGGRRWVFLFRWHGKPTEIGLGSARDVTLARARELAGQARAKLAEGNQSKEREEADATRHIRRMRRSANRGHAAVLAEREAHRRVGDDFAALRGAAASVAGRYNYDR